VQPQRGSNRKHQAGKKALGFGEKAAKPIFLSYAREASKEFVPQLYAKLGPEQVFLHTEEIEHGNLFPRTLSEALLNARVVVVFLGTAYFSRWYCLRELNLALLPFNIAARRGAAPDVLVQAARHIVVVLPADPGERDALDNLPPQIRIAAWTSANETEAVAQLIERRLTECQRSIQESVNGSREAAVALATLLENRQSQLRELLPAFLKICVASRYR
jgi:hypothetical protein